MLTRWKVWNAVAATEAGFLAVIAVVFLFNAMHYWPQVIDDAYIAFRFAENLVTGHGLRFNQGGELVEGFTSPAWVVLSAGAILLRLDSVVVAKIAGMGSGVAALVLSFLIAKVLRGRTDGWNLLPPLLLATNAHFAFWAMQGMETLLQSAAVLAAYYWTLRWVEDRRCAVLSAAAVVFAVFVRIDSVVLMAPLGVFVLAWVILHARRTELSSNAGDGPVHPDHHEGEPAGDNARQPVRVVLPMVRWMIAIGCALMVMQAMRFLIFGEWLPNTYHAKVAFAPWEGERAGAYLLEFFFNQGGWTDGQDVGTVGWWLSGGPANSLAWMNLWLATVLLLTAQNARLPFDKGARNVFLLIAAIATATWYAWHVGGDWMPGFRFLVPSLVFIAIGTPIAIDALWKLTAPWPAVRISALALFLLAFVGSIAEQMRTETAYVFGRDPIWQERTERWLSAAAIGRRLERGFQPALIETAANIALETQDGATILMSDIGLPMWSAPHLRLIDADGLVDKHLADAPSVRQERFGGDPIPTRARIRRDVTFDARDRPMTSEVRRWIREETKRLYRDEVMRRNTRMIMEHVRPEYILVFEVHPGVGTAQPGRRYPEIIERVTEHPEFERYVLHHSWPKAEGNVWNHLYRREDVPEEILPHERRQRRTALRERNPRVRIFALMEAAGGLADP